ncbi:secreted Ly-6/uPAR domain-containing protein 2-like [Plectropomus leopardus]|uniref:secreted Ly-6/uPAR domain-containing protein 2-like n=1 Tax=Plectropomus leopardus TaxID=160734 RepID=UPI001C4AEE71|nr:secreted Ly-6/uPAR domain-containing protein 2-like [Plectropomus leopardus]
MQLFGPLILFMTLSAVCGLRCHHCTSGESCTEQLTCPPIFERCTSFVLHGVVTKGCMLSNLCIDPIKCCATDLCNSDEPAIDIPKPTGSSNIPTGSSVLLLLVSSSIVTLFL